VTCGASQFLREYSSKVDELIKDKEAAKRRPRRSPRRRRRSWHSR